MSEIEKVDVKRRLGVLFRALRENGSSIHALSAKRLHKSKLNEGDIFVGQIEGSSGFTYLFLMKDGRAVAITSEDAIENCRRQQQFGKGNTFSVDMADVKSAYSNYGPNVVNLLEFI